MVHMLNAVTVSITQMLMVNDENFGIQRLFRFYGNWTIQYSNLNFGLKSRWTLTMLNYHIDYIIR